MKNDNALVKAEVAILFDVKDDIALSFVKDELEAALNTTCSMLEQSDARHPGGCVSYRLHVEILAGVLK